MSIREWLRNLWLDVAWITIDDLDDRFECLENKLNQIGNTIMATIAELKVNEDAAVASITKYISDVNSATTELAAEVADLTAKLANTPGVLTADQQTQLDAINASAQAISSSVADAEAKLGVSASTPAPTPAPAPVDSSDTPTA